MDYMDWKEFVRPNKWKIIIVSIFILTWVLGFFQFPYFTEYEIVGDVGFNRPSILITGPIYPLIAIWELFENSIDTKAELGPTGALLMLVLTFIVLLIYYYILSCLLVFIYGKLKQKFFTKSNKQSPDFLFFSR